ncbi:MAG TPA: phenylalanine--tRNA ligase subunit beta [Steroidobacteraceae bacterium]|nr:phenylalanine--tRNA ligase subunit beta [Steroidobacteraceae bacterium]
MKISLQWLRDWTDTGTDVRGLAHALTMVGLEVEAIQPAAPPLASVVVGEVKSIARHPDAEKLNVCRVWNGLEELQIVCGAPNVRVGMKAPLALIGAKLPNGAEIKQAKLRGVESSGMLCSARELGLSDDASGLFDLPAELTAGQELIAALGLDDTIFEINLTPNRGDCMSVAGVAREVAALRQQALHPPATKAVEPKTTERFAVRLEGGNGCPKFVSRVIRGIRPNAQSPLWMRERLRRAGLRPISAVVDVTNYVMLELGQPLHGYDLDKLNGSIIVRFARAGETLKMLDGRVIELTPDILMIADERTLLGMAGVMGGEDSGISDGTTNVLLEGAFFTPSIVAGRGRRYGLITDASQRFERGVDPELQERAIERATQLLLDSAGGTPAPIDVTRTAERYPARSPIRVRHQRIQHVLGAPIAADIAAECLTRLGMKVEPAASDTWSVTPPSWRFDIGIEEDLIEEVARLYGFDNIPERHEIAAQRMQPWTETRVRNERAGDLLVDRGYQEAITYSFTEPATQALLLPEPAFALANPISAELAVMRVSLWPGLLQALGSNQRRQQQRVRLFEIGRRYAGADGAETEVIAGVVSGSALPEQWGTEPIKVDFFDVKSDVEALLGLSGEPAQFRFVPEQHPALHPGQSARISRGERPVGWLGALHPEHSRRLDLTYPVFVFEVETQSALSRDIPVFAEISRYPAIGRDIAVIVDEGLPAEALLATVREAAGALLQGLTVLSIYRGHQFEKGKKSIALGLQLQDTSRTLTDSEADAIVARVIEQLKLKLHATIRDK